MDAAWKWNGARWWKFDCHAHTPQSDCYGEGDAALKARTPEEWLLDHMRAGFDCVAVTDHNSGEWIDRLQEAAANETLRKHPDFRELVLFPGVELFVNGGFHVLAILGADKTGADVTRLTGACGYDSASGATTKSFSEVAAAIAATGGVVLPAHVDERDKKGLWALSDEKTWQQVLAVKTLTAWEVMDASQQPPDVVVRSGRQFTRILGSDSHCPEKVGTRWSWVKMTMPSIGELRLALQDGELAVRPSDKYPDDPNNVLPALAVESVTVTDAKYLGRTFSDGRLNTFAAAFGPWLNAIIGGRGTGKSSLLEFMRIALRREGELAKAFDKEQIRENFERYRITGEKGLLLPGALIQIVYRKEGQRYRIQWSVNGNATAIEEETHGGWVRADGDIAARFPASIYSQKQLFALAGNPAALLDIIDQTPDINRQEWDQKRSELEGSFLSLRAKERELQARLTDETRLRGELADIERRLAVWEKKATRDTLRAFQRLAQQRVGLENWTAALDETVARLAAYPDALTLETLNTSIFDTGTQNEKAVLDRIQTTTAAWAGVIKAVQTGAVDAGRVAQEWKTWLDRSEWKKQAQEIEAEYAGLIEQLAGEGVADAADYGNWLQQKQALEARLRAIAGYRTEIARLQAQATGKLSEIRSHRRDLTEKRRQFLSNILATNSFVRMDVIPYGELDDAHGQLSELLRCEDARYSTDVTGLLDSVYFPDGKSYISTWKGVDASQRMQLEEDMDKRLVALKKRIGDCALGTVPESLGRGWFRNKLKDAAQSPETLNHLDLSWPGDSVHVSYANPATGKFSALDQASPGQKTAAILAFVLSYGQDPMILDQPEDDLDNHWIYELVVRQIQESKKRRQIIVVTHNANIAVNGDAELVLALKSDGGRTEYEAQGGLQEADVRDTVCLVMEGGRDAFARRYDRIVGGTGHV